MDTEGRQGNIVVMKKVELEEKNIISVKDNKERRNIIIEKNIAKIVRDNEELNNTIIRVTENSIEEKDNIIDMLKDMMIENKERVAKLLNTLRADVKSKSRAE